MTRTAIVEQKESVLCFSKRFIKLYARMIISLVLSAAQPATRAVFRRQLPSPIRPHRSLSNRKDLDQARISSHDVSYVEAHGTGT